MQEERETLKNRWIDCENGWNYGTFAIYRFRDLELERSRRVPPLLLPRSGSRNAEVAESWDSIVLSMNVDKTPIDNKVKRVECDPPPSPSPSPVKLGQVLTSKQSDPAIKRCKVGGKACKGARYEAADPIYRFVLFLIPVILDGIERFSYLFSFLSKNFFPRRYNDRWKLEARNGNLYHLYSQYYSYWNYSIGYLSMNRRVNLNHGNVIISWICCEINYIFKRLFLKGLSSLKTFLNFLFFHI